MTPNAFQSKSSKSLAWIQDPFLETWLLWFSKIEHFLSWIPQSKKVFHPVKNPLKAIGGFVKLGVAYPERSTHVKSANMHNLSTMPVLNKNSETSFLQSLRAPQKNYRVVEGFWKYSKKKCSTSQTSPIRFFTFQLIQSIRTFSQRRPRQRQRKSKGSPISPPFCFNLISELVIRCCFKMPLENLFEVKIVFVHDIKFLLFPYSFSYLLKSHWTLQAFLTCLDKISSSCLSCDRYSGTFYLKLKYFFFFSF